MWPVFPHLFLGSSEAAQNLPALHIHSITTLVALRQPGNDQQQLAAPQFRQAFQYETVDVDLSMTGDAFVREMSRAVDVITVIVERQEAGQGRVLLYDDQPNGSGLSGVNGQSKQSAALTVTLLYLMKTFNSSFERAWAHLQSASAGSLNRLPINEQIILRCKELESLLHSREGRTRVGSAHKRAFDHEIVNNSVSDNLVANAPSKRILIDTGSSSQRKDVA